MSKFRDMPNYRICPNSEGPKFRGIPKTRDVKILHHRFLPHNFKFTGRHINFSSVFLITFTVQGTSSSEIKR